MKTRNLSLLLFVSFMFALSSCGGDLIPYAPTTNTTAAASAITYAVTTTAATLPASTMVDRKETLAEAVVTAAIPSDSTVDDTKGTLSLAPVPTPVPMPVTTPAPAGIIQEILSNPATQVDQKRAELAQMYSNHIHEEYDMMIPDTAKKSWYAIWSAPLTELQNLDMSDINNYTDVTSLLNFYFEMKDANNEDCDWDIGQWSYAKDLALSTEKGFHVLFDYDMKDGTFIKDIPLSSNFSADWDNLEEYYIRDTIQDIQFSDLLNNFREHFETLERYTLGDLLFYSYRSLDAIPTTATDPTQPKPPSFSIAKTSALSDLTSNATKDRSPPKIVITTNYNLKTNAFNAVESYLNAVEAAGGIPIQPKDDNMLADAIIKGDSTNADEIAARYDGLLLSGGGDISARFFGQQKHPAAASPDENRDIAEIALCQAFVRAGKPVLGINRGMQVINVAMGGDIIQDIPDILGISKNVHSGGNARHNIEITPDSWLFYLFGNTLQTPSSHHQSVGKLAEGFKIAARVEQVIEAIEHDNVIGVQFHPERLSWEGALIYSDFVNKCYDAR